VTTTFSSPSHTCTVPTLCHPERSLAESEATRQTQSKDPYRTEAADGSERNFRIVIRFFDKQNPEVCHESSREAAIECSPRRKPWEARGNETSPEGAKEDAAGIINATA
jgi:hypothetical protein